MTQKAVISTRAVDHQSIFAALRAIGTDQVLEDGSLSHRLLEPLLVGQSSIKKVAIILGLVKEILKFNI